MQILEENQEQIEKELKKYKVKEHKNQNKSNFSERDYVKKKIKTKNKFQIHDDILKICTNNKLNFHPKKYK